MEVDVFLPPSLQLDPLAYSLEILLQRFLTLNPVGYRCETESPVKVSDYRISLEIADFLAIRCIVKALKTSGAEETRILTRKGIIHSHPSKIKIP